MKSVSGWTDIYWCIDLHGTIIPSGKDSDDTSDKMEFYVGAKEVLQYLSNRTDSKLILWTSTPITRISSIGKWLTDNEISFDYLNSNPHAENTPRSDFRKKFYMSIILDDRAGFSPTDGDWILVAKELELITGDSIIKWDSSKEHEFKSIIRKNMEWMNSYL